MFLLFASTLLGCVEGCPRENEVPWNPPVVITDSDHCKLACEHLRDLKCKEGDPVKATGDAGYVSCEDFCRETQSNGVWLNPKCVEQINTCSELETCAVIKK